MKRSFEIRLGPDGWKYKRTLTVGRSHRISPHSYKMGEGSGLIAGLGLGFAFGVVISCLAFVINSYR